MTTETTIVRDSEKTVTGVVDGLLWRWLPIITACLTQTLHPLMQAETLAVLGAMICCLATMKSNWYWVACTVCTTLSVLCLAIPSLYTINIGYWGMLSATCLLGTVAAQHLRSPAHRKFELQILRDKLPYPRLMLCSVLVPVALSNVAWVATGAEASIWLAAPILAITATLSLGTRYVWVYGEK